MRLGVGILMLLALPAWSLSPAEEGAERHYEAGLQMLAQSRYKDASAELDVALELAPERAEIQNALSAARQRRQPEATVASAPASVPAPVQDPASAKMAKECAPIFAEAKAGLAKLAFESYKKDSDQPFDSSVEELYAAALREARKEHFVEAQKKLEEALSLNPPRPG